MPPEILSEIFIRCQSTPSFHPTDRDGGVCLDTVPFLLGKICSRWRYVSLSTPKLWASIQLSVGFHNAESRAMMAKTWLARSGTCPLSIALNIRRGYAEFSSELLMQVLLRHSDRWRSIYLCMPLSDIKCFSPAKNWIPQLQRLLVNVTDFIDAPPPRWKEMIDIFECAPQLHSFNLAPDSPTSLLKVPYHQLKYLDLQGRSATETLNILGLTLNLETCVVSPTMQESQHPPVLLRNLRYIHISIWVNLGNFFDRLSLPMLRELSIDLQDDDPWMGIPELICLISRSSLETFLFHCRPNLSHRYLQHSDMIKVLLAAPSLVELDLSGGGPEFMTKSFLAQFTCHCKLEQMNVPQLLPRLRTIKVDYTPSFFDILAFADAVQSRMMVNSTGGASQETVSTACIRRVQIRWFPVTEPLDSKVLSRWQQLQDLGLDLSIIPRR